MIKIFIIVLSYNVKSELRDCLLSLEGLRNDGFEMHAVVVDNKSSDMSVDFVKRKFPRVKLIENSENLGYTGGNNVGIKYALENFADYVLIVNPDTTLDKNLLVELLSQATKEPKAGILGPKIYFAPGFEYHKDLYHKADLGNIIWWAGGIIDWDNVTTVHRGVDEVGLGRFTKSEKTNVVAGAVMIVKREVFEKIGLFDERYFLYFEESDFCLRAKKAGFDLWYVPGATAWHKNAKSAGVGSSLQDYYTTRNQLLFGFSYAPIRSKIALIRQSLSLLLSGRPWQKRGVVDFFLGRFSQGSYNS